MSIEVVNGDNSGKARIKTKRMVFLEDNEAIINNQHIDYRTGGDHNAKRIIIDYLNRLNGLNLNSVQKDGLETLL